MKVVHPYFKPRTLGDDFGQILRDPVVPHLTGMQVLKMFGLAAAGVWLLKGIGNAFGR